MPFLIQRMDPALDALIAADSKLETIVSIPDVSSEGPMWRDGRLWFSDQRGGSMYAVTMDGKAEEIGKLVAGPINPEARYNQGPNGQAAYANGAVLVCRQGLRDIGLLNKDGKFSDFLSHYEGKRLNAPNDMVIGRDGTLWFTDPAFSTPGYRGGGTPTPDSQLPIQGVYRYKDGKLTRPISDMTLPNGIGLSPDGKTLYVSSGTPMPHIRAYDVGRDGALSNQRMLSNYGLVPNSVLRGAVDGMKVDSKGNLWATGPGGISVISSAGKLLGRIQLPAGSTNVAFGGSDYRSIFFTSGSTIYRLPTIVPGLKPMYARP